VALDLDTSTPFGERASRRLRDELIGWLVTVSPHGEPQPSPVWFLWDGTDSFLVYSRPNTPKLRNIRANPKAALHLDGNGRGGDIVVVWASAAESSDPPAYQVPAYVAKYGGLIAGNGWTPESFSADYSVPVRLAARRLRGS
jgi:PPOX class probable F420-dependent enzyme